MRTVRVRGRQPSGLHFDCGMSLFLGLGGGSREQYRHERSPRNEVNASMATADHDRQGQAAHRQYKSHTVIEFASGKPMHNRHS